MKAIQTAVLFASIFAPVVAFGSLGSGSTQESAQQPAGPSAGTPTEVVNTVAAKLNLTEDQKAKIQPIIADRQQKWAALRADTSLRPIEKKRKLKGIFEDSDQKIKARLNEQ
jgi:periplasmic protein CpxP/Spy